MAKENAIEVKNLKKVFGFMNKFVAVDNLNMEIEAGAVYGFIGPNGAGKTTTIKMLVGAIKPTMGQGYIFGEPIGSVRARSYIGYSPEHPNFYPMAARDFLIYIAELCGMPKADAGRRADELLDVFGLKRFANSNAMNFSAGMKQKLGLAQAFISDPQVLILDEPTANLDPIGRYEVMNIVEQLAREQKKTVFISSHILLELEKMIDHVTILDKGKVVMQDSMAELKRRFSENHYVIDSTDNELLLARLKKDNNVIKVWQNPQAKLEVMVKSGPDFKKSVIGIFNDNKMQLNEFSAYQMSLENIFLKSVGRGEENGV